MLIIKILYIAFMVWLLCTFFVLLQWFWDERKYTKKFNQDLKKTLFALNKKDI